MTDAVDQFLEGPFEHRLSLASGAEPGSSLRRHLGEKACAAYARLAASVSSVRTGRHLGAALRPSVVVVPGVMGSLICSRGMGGVWWVDAPRLLSRLNDLRLAPGGLQDLEASFRLTPCAVDHTYAPLLAALARREHVSYEVFPYDWRKMLTASSDAFRDLIVSEHERAQNQRVHIIAHSMGGLMVRAALMKHGDVLWSKIGRIVFIATPHYGSPAIISYLKDHFWGFNLLTLLGRFLNRDTFRSMWGVLSLLPAPAGVYPSTRDSNAASPSHPCVDADLHQSAAYNLSLTPDQQTQLQAALDHARDFSRALYEWHRALPFEYRSKMAVIAGVGKRTLFRVELGNTGLSGLCKKVTARVEGDQHREGDGRVPLASARLEGVAATYYAPGEHDALPMIPAVYEGALDWLNGNTVHLPESPGAALRQHLGPAKLSPEAPELLPARADEPDTESPGYLSEEAAEPGYLDELERQLKAGELPDFQRVRIL